MLFSTILLKTKVGGARMEDSARIADEMERHAKIHGFRVIRNIKEVDAPEHTIMIPIGGDGTALAGALETLKHGRPIPIIGINIGNLGFLTDLPPTQTREMTHAFFDSLKDPSGLKYDRRTVLEVKALGSTCMAMNDVVVSGKYSDTMIQYKLHVGASFAGKHKANSLIVSTPTGSTAYAMAAGGAIIEPDLDVMEIIPVAAASMSARPMIVGGHNVVTVRVSGNADLRLSVKADGQSLPYVLPPDHNTTLPYEVKIIRLEEKVTLIHAASWNFFDVLSEKLHWNSR